jgi:tetratricopeptide (TPR) repeat protein
VGLFSRQKRDTEDTERDAEPPRPIDPESVDLVEAKAVVAALAQAVGSDAEMRRAILRLQEASGMPHPDNAGATMAAFQEDRHFTTRLWRWLRAVASKANKEGQSDIAARAAYWSLVWNTTVVPNMVGADFISLGFDRPPDDVLKELLEEGGLALAELEDDFVVAQTAEPETVTAAMLRTVFPTTEAAPVQPATEEKGGQTHAESSASYTEGVADAVPDTSRGAAEEAESPSGATEAGNLDALLDLGDRLLQEGDIDGAQGAYDRVEGAGDVRGSLKLAALMEDHREDHEAAEAAWRRADEAGDLNGAGNLGRLLREKGDARGAEAAYRRCVDRGSDRAIADWAGLLFRRENASSEEVTEAIARLCGQHDRFIWHEDTSVIAHVFILDEMKERCDPMAIEAGTRRADEQDSAAGAWHLAWALRAKGDLPEAVAAFRRAAERGFDEAWVKGAGACLEMGDARAAEAMARDGDRAGSATASGMLGAILDENGRADEALEAYKRADAGGDGGGSFNLGIELLNRGDLRGAEEALQRAVECETENAEAALAHVRRLLASQ